MKILGIEAEELVNCGAIHTAREIAQQPALWRRVVDDMRVLQPALQDFLNTALDKTGSRIILTGAGTSAFIGLSLKGIFQQQFGIGVESIATTDIVTHPKDYFLPDTATLLISFARSGNSPESLAAIQLADEICKTCYHLVITCNSEGSIATHRSPSNTFLITLPSESNDKSLAMTSSYTCMLLTGLLIASLKDFENAAKDTLKAAAYTERFLEQSAERVKALAAQPFSRAVFLGSGAFYGTATEAHLKLQELTSGQVICKNDSFLGFRHGPKAVIDEQTLVVYFMSQAGGHALNYEKDLIGSMKKGTTPLLEIIVAESDITDTDVTERLYFTETGSTLTNEHFLTLSYIVPMQMLSFFKSLQLGLSADMPSTNNAISRVVEGVRIYSMLDNQSHG